MRSQLLNILLPVSLWLFCNLVRYEYLYVDSTRNLLSFLEVQFFFIRFGRFGNIISSNTLHLFLSFPSGNFTTTSFCACFFFSFVFLSVLQIVFKLLSNSLILLSFQICCWFIPSSKIFISVIVFFKFRISIWFYFLNFYLFTDILYWYSLFFSLNMTLFLIKAHNDCQSLWISLLTFWLLSWVIASPIQGHNLRQAVILAFPICWPLR